MQSARASDNVQRKLDHVYVALNRDVEYHTVTTGFERYCFTYEALPEIDLSRVDTSVTLFGKRLSFPLIISSMTGGAPDTAVYNRHFASAAAKFGIAMGVGSQRVAIDDPSLAYTFQVRDIAPDIPLFANMGAIQLNNGHGIESCLEAVEMIWADALMLHLNPLQECVQPSGNTNFHDLAARIAELCEAIDVPVIVKEVGHGISGRTAALLMDTGIDGIDVAGAGGTSWAKVESERGIDEGLTALGATLGEWGIPTVDSLIAVRQSAPGAVVIASGGVRTGMDIAKAVALGADAAGMALPLLRAAAVSPDHLYASIDHLRREFATVLFCTGSGSVADLRASARLVEC